MITLFTSVKLFATLTLASAFLISLIATECTQIVIDGSSVSELNDEEFGTCSENEFECRNGECIDGELLCDGKADCPDQSDETQAECTRPELRCPNWAFRCDYGACVDGNAICNGVKDCLDNSDELLLECRRVTPRLRSAIFLGYVDDERLEETFNFRPKISLSRNRGTTSTRRRIYRVRVPKLQTTPTSTRTSIPSSILRPLIRRPPLTPSTSFRSSTTLTSFCIVPPQPVNGQWKLHRRFCKDNRDCDIPQGIALRPGSQLVYSCIENYMVDGNSNVYCESGGGWSSIPICVVTTCRPLNSISRAATCSLFGDRVSCRSPILPFTRATVTCRINYGPDTGYLTSLEQNVECGTNGRWNPEPITCSPVCGVTNNFGQESIAINGILTEAGPLPWHANLWKQISTPRGTQLEFRCSATIIETKFVVTAAHCVIENTIGVTENPRNLRVTAGNSQDASSIVYKVKNVYRYCEYFGQVHGYTADIALVELNDPFEFSTFVLPACLDVSSESELTFRPGVTGKSDGFGRRSASTPSPVLQTVEVTYVSNSECRTSYNPSDRDGVISNDEFCGVFSNESSICDWDSGGGFVAKKGGLWHLEGVFKSILGLDLESNNARTCGENPYSLYTKISPYMAWIQDAMFNIERYKSYPVCNFDLTPLPTTTTTPTPTRTTWSTATPDITSSLTTQTTATPTTTESVVEMRTSPSARDSSCFVPPQPANGRWKLREDLCNNTNCDIPVGSKLGPGSQLTYSCDSGFRITGNTDVTCLARGGWSVIPNCTEIVCSSLESTSRMVTCYQSNHWTPCNSSALPKTRAEISCRLGFSVDVNSFKTGSTTVQCNENGEWEPDPITCVPLCGIKNTQLTPTILNGTSASITDFPWHATLYRQMNATQGPKEFICGATIIQDNLLLTAAHCVYDDVRKVVEIPEKFSVATGNKFRDYDSPSHDSRVVQKSPVKNVYVPCEYYGFQGNYASDIAVIELREPFHLSNVLMPACLDVLGNNDQILEPGAVGNFAGFGRTETGKTSGALLSTMIPYVAYSQCRMSQKDDSNVALIGKDKFCGGNIEGMSAVCEGDSGGGLTFDNGGRSNVMGILSVNLGTDTSTGERTCDGKAYSLYTKVSNHMPWIRDVMRHLERDKSYPSCGSG